MVYEHLKFETGKRESFVKHEEVLAYLKRYAEPVRELIRVRFKRGPVGCWNLTRAMQVF